MIKLQCELCGSNDIVKEDDVFKCQYCGCKYTVEQAKKLMIEGVVNVQGTVQIDNNEKIEGLYKIARRARDNNDWEGAKKYYDLVLQEDSNSWEATFFLAYFDAYYCKNGELKLKAVKMCNCITSVTTLINESKMSLQEKINAYSLVGNNVLSISDGLQERAKKFRNQMIGIKATSLLSLLTSKDQQVYYDTVVPMINCKYFFANGLEKVIDQFAEYPQVKKYMISFWEKANNDLVELFKKRLSTNNKQVIETYKKKIAKYSA